MTSQPHAGNPLNSISQILSDLHPQIQRTTSDPRPIVLMMCGMTGSGKSTLSKSILKAVPTFTQRLSIDTYIHARHGIYGIDYLPPCAKSSNSKPKKALRSELIGFLRREAAESELRSRQCHQDEAQIQTQIEDGNNLILDLSLPRRTDRDEYKSLIETEGGRWVLIFLDIGEGRRV